MHMLLENNARVYPNVWQSTWVAGRLPQHVSVLPDVSKWLQSNTPHSSPPRVVVVIRDEYQRLTLRYELWVLWEPYLREERVLAYRAHPDAVCACCRVPALWKLPRGRRGCAALIMRSVARALYWPRWRQQIRQLSRTPASVFERMLLYEWFSMGVFEMCYVDLDSLSCSCYGCPLAASRAGVLCLRDQVYVDKELDGPGSPRRPCEHLVD
jgi:hypothetical protein